VSRWIHAKTLASIVLFSSVSIVFAGVNDDLSLAVERGDTQEVQNLLAKGADVNAVVRRSHVLFGAAAGGNVAMVELLLAHGGDVNSATPYSGTTALMGAAMNGHDTVVHALLANGAKIDAKDPSGRAALSWVPLAGVETKGHVAVVRTLLTAGADVNAGDASGVTTLMLAAMYELTEVARELLDHGAKADMKSNDGMMALEMALLSHSETANLIRERTQGSTANTGNQSAWHYLNDEDDMGRGKIRHAIVLSTNTVSLGSPYTGTQRAMLTLRKHSAGRDVRFRIKKGQLMCSMGCKATVRFDEGKPVTFRASGPDDHSTETIFLEGYDRFITGVKKAKRTRIEVTFYQAGARVFDFNTGGLVWD
jgi:hypothetical protein